MKRAISFDDRDEFNRKPIAEKFLRLLDSDIKFSPIVVNGGWGTGKTEFSKKVASLIQEKNPKNKVVFIDAFSEDYGNASLLTIIAAIASLYPEEAQTSLISKTLPALRFSLKTVMKAGTGWVLKQNADDIAEGFEDALKDAANSMIDKTVETMMKDHIESKENMEALRNALIELTKNNKITIIIDELDRCKPSFALSIIENIKHVFDIENLCFILVANIEQLKNSIDHLYGPSVNSHKYLDKFIKYSFTIPQNFMVAGYIDVEASGIHWQTLSRESIYLPCINHKHDIFMASVIKHFKLTLREVETLARYLESYQLLSDNGINDKDLISESSYRILAIVVYCFNQDLAIKYIQDTATAEEILNFFKKTHFQYNTNINSVSAIDIFTFGICFKYIDSASKHFPIDSRARQEWIDAATKCSGFIIDPNKVFKDTIKTISLRN